MKVTHIVGTTVGDGPCGIRRVNKDSVVCHYIEVLVGDSSR